jgi:methionyl-tRNA formyltransferase
VPSGAASGTVVTAGAGGIDIAAGDGQILRLLTLQLEGGRPLTAADFQAGRGLAVGDECGPS